MPAMPGVGCQQQHQLEGQRPEHKLPEHLNQAAHQLHKQCLSQAEHQVHSQYMNQVLNQVRNQHLSQAMHQMHSDHLSQSPPLISNNKGIAGKV